MSTDKQKAHYLEMSNLDKRIEVWMLKNQGWSFNQIARKFGVSPQGIQTMYIKVKDLTLDELENQRLLIDNRIK